MIPVVPTPEARRVMVRVVSAGLLTTRTYWEASA